MKGLGFVHLPKGVMQYAIGVGMLLAWWNICHEGGLLFLSDQMSRAVSCMGSSAGGVIALVALFFEEKSGKRPKGSGGPVLIAVMMAVGLILDAFAPSGFLGAIVLLQACAGALLFFVLASSAFMFDNLGSKSLGRVAVVALTAYCLSEATVFLAYEATGFEAVRGALHAIVLIAGGLLAQRAMSSEAEDVRRKGTSRSRDSLAFVSGRGVPWQFAFHVLAYSIVFGVTHALASGVVPVNMDKIAPCYVGTGAAALLVFVMVESRDETEAFWPLLRQYVFPVAMLSFVLLPFANIGAMLVSVAMAECAADAYFAFLFIAAILAARKIGISARCAIAVSAGISSIGMVLGVGIGNALRIGEYLAPTTYNILTALALVLLCAGTFWVGNDKQVFYVWGLEKRLTPKRFAEKLIEDRCRIVSEKFGLTKRESEVLVALAQKQTPQDIADRNFIALNTVRTHIARIHRKTQTHSQREIEALLENVEDERRS